MTSSRLSPMQYAVMITPVYNVRCTDQVMNIAIKGVDALPVDYIAQLTGSTDHCAIAAIARKPPRQSPSTIVGEDADYRAHIERAVDTLFHGTIDIFNKQEHERRASVAASDRQGILEAGYRLMVTEGYEGFQALNGIAESLSTDGMGGIEHLIPELRGKSASVLEHLIKSVRAMNNEIYEGGISIVRNPDLSRLCRLVALFHDIGAEIFEKMVRERLNPYVSKDEQFSEMEIALGRYLITAHRDLADVEAEIAAAKNAQAKHAVMKGYLERVIFDTQDLQRRGMDVSEIFELNVRVHVMNIMANASILTNTQARIQEFDMLAREMRRELPLLIDDIVDESLEEPCAWIIGTERMIEDSDGNRVATARFFNSSILQMLAAKRRRRKKKATTPVFEIMSRRGKGTISVGVNEDGIQIDVQVTNPKTVASAMKSALTLVGDVDRPLRNVLADFIENTIKTVGGVM